MENIDIQTSQNIAIEQSLASVGERIVATALDYVFMILYIIIVSILGGLTKSTPVIFLFMIQALLYHLILEMMMKGQSPGKKIMKIKVVKIDGTQATFFTYFIRWIFRLVDITMLFGSIATITIIINGKGQRLGDIAANTTVIRLKNKSLESGIFTDLPDNYNLNYPQVSRLTDSDISIAWEVLNFIRDSH